MAEQPLPSYVPPSACTSCDERMPLRECPQSKRACGHHCNCSWTQDVCHWCGQTFSEDTKPPEKTSDV